MKLFDGLVIVFVLCFLFGELLVLSSDFFFLYFSSPSSQLIFVSRNAPFVLPNLQPLGAMVLILLCSRKSKETIEVFVVALVFEWIMILFFFSSYFP